jgi:hypothetical protein
MQKALMKDKLSLSIRKGEEGKIESFTFEEFTNLTMSSNRKS